MADSLAVRRKKEQDKRIQQITRGQTLSVRRPGLFERIYDYIDQPVAALAKRLGMSEADAYEYSKRLSGAIEGLTGAEETEMSARKVAKGKGTAGDYVNLSMAVLPGAIGAAALEASQGQPEVVEETEEFFVLSDGTKVRKPKAEPMAYGGLMAKYGVR